MGDSRSEVCWAAVTRDGRFAYVTNFGDGTISSYQITADGSPALHDPVVAAPRQGEKGIRDEAISRDGRFLYAIDADAQRLFGWQVLADGGWCRSANSRVCPRRSLGWPPAEAATPKAH